MNKSVQVGQKSIFETAGLKWPKQISIVTEIHSHKLQVWGSEKGELKSQNLIAKPVEKFYNLRSKNNY